MIAFSDNVQDAAHRAGFFAARTWRNSIRAAIAQVVAAHDGITLAELPDRVAAWWGDRAANPGAFDAERFVSEFIAPDRLWLREFVELQRRGRLSADPRLPDMVARRMRWDTLAELGYASTIGRTVERTRAVAVGVEHTALEQACIAAGIRIREEFEQFRDLGHVPVRALILGILRRMKDRGATASDLVAGYLAAGGSRWRLGRDIALQEFGPRSAVPIFPADRAAGDGLEQATAKSSWYRIWVETILSAFEPLAATQYGAEVLLTVLDALESAGLVRRVDAGPARAWALAPERFYATARVAVMLSSGSGRTLVVPEREAELWLGVPCLELGAPGVYERHDAKPPTWFGRLYRETAIRASSPLSILRSSAARNVTGCSTVSPRPTRSRGSQTCSRPRRLWSWESISATCPRLSCVRSRPHRPTTCNVSDVPVAVTAMLSPLPSLLGSLTTSTSTRNRSTCWRAGYHRPECS